MPLLAAQLAGELGAAGTPGLEQSGIPAMEGPAQQAELFAMLQRMLLMQALFGPAAPLGPSGASVGAHTPPEQVAGPAGGGMLASILGALRGLQRPAVDPRALVANDQSLQQRMLRGSFVDVSGSRVGQGSGPRSVGHMGGSSGGPGPTA